MNQQNTAERWEKIWQGLRSGLGSQSSAEPLGFCVRVLHQVFSKGSAEFWGRFGSPGTSFENWIFPPEISVFSYGVVSEGVFAESSFSFFLQIPRKFCGMIRCCLQSSFCQFRSGRAQTPAKTTTESGSHPQIYQIWPSRQFLLGKHWGKKAPKP